MEKSVSRKDENPSADGFSDARKRQSRIIFVVKMDERQVKVQRTGISHQANQYFDARKRQSRKIFVAKKTIKAGKVQRTGMSHQRNQYFGALHLVCVLQNKGYNYQRCAAPKKCLHYFHTKRY